MLKTTVIYSFGAESKYTSNSACVHSPSDVIYKLTKQQPLVIKEWVKK